MGICKGLFKGTLPAFFAPVAFAAPHHNVAQQDIAMPNAYVARGIAVGTGATNCAREPFKPIV